MIKTSVYLVLSAKKNQWGWKLGPAKVFKTKPSPGRNQIAVKVALEIPESLFQEPSFEATVKLPEASKRMIDPIVISKDVSQALSDRLGFNVTVEMQSTEAAATTAAIN